MDPLPAGTPVLDAATIDDVGKGVDNYLWKQHRSAYIATLVGSAFAALVCATLLYLYDPYFLSSDQNDSSILLVLFVLFLPPVVMNLAATRKIQREFVQQMATALGFTYSTSAPTESVSGTFFSLGHSPHLTDVMSGTYKDRLVRIYTYQYTTGSGKNQQTHTYTVFEMNYGAPLPHIIMNVPELFAPGDVEHVELEGNFDNDFKLFVSKGQQMEIREIFQPDVMQELISSFTSFSMEISGATVYIMRTGTLTNKQKFLDIISAIDKLFDDILPGLEAIARDQVTSARSV